MKTYRELIAWQKGIELVLLAYKITRKFPKKELYALADQIKRSSVSIPSNIAEGFGRHSDNDFIRFLNISRGSLFELQTQLEISFRLDFIKSEDYEVTMQLAVEIDKMLNALISKIKQNSSMP
ncbi:MAG: four helix bundle protein [Prolixibacteraceae bacterium]|jgi:four helix bundle protein|nr:four helix bundle protein [Prolixibacteraceae bacterium]